MELLGIDIGGSGIKGAIVDLSTGELVSQRLRVETPKSRKDVTKAVATLVNDFAWSGPVGCTFPAVAIHGTILTAANIDKDWIGANAEQIFSEATGLPFRVLNDADAAGMAEMTFGAGQGVGGTVIVLTIGTGIGSAVFTDGVLVQNTEFGHIKFKGGIAEEYCSDLVRKSLDLTWKEWGLRFREYVAYLEKLFSPELVVIGGGASKKFDKFEGQLKLRCKAVPAALLNDSGIVGAALAAGATVSVGSNN